MFQFLVVSACLDVEPVAFVHLLSWGTAAETGMGTLGFSWIWIETLIGQQEERRPARH